MFMLSLSNGELTVEGATKSDLQNIHRRLRKDLLDLDIPHYRPIAFKLENNTTTTRVKSNVERITALGCSYAEMSFVLDKLITNKQGGSIDRTLADSAMVSLLTMNCSYVSLNGTTIGPKVPNTVYFSQESVSSKVPLLLTDINIMEKLKQSINISVILAKGTGFKDFNDNSILLSETGYKALRTTYSLYDYISLDTRVDKGYLKLHYKEKLDENVLLGILEEYMEGLNGDYSC